MYSLDATRSRLCVRELSDTISAVGTSFQLQDLWRRLLWHLHIRTALGFCGKASTVLLQVLWRQTEGVDGLSM